MHGNANMVKNKMTGYELKDVYGTRLLANFLLLSKVRFKVTPIERQSL